ncbi:MAG: DEAD/DEAH box helicase [Leptolyngbya sp. SIO4C1]|nr:DEAD/DEAH box helicase [Leptolyngbya sp. SIO4C1]
MQILHGTWIPEPDADFVQSGRFYLWIETTARQPELEARGCYPLQLTGDELVRTLTDEFKLQSGTPDWIEPCYFLLPTVDSAPLPSLELSRYLEIALPETFEFEYWEVDGYPVDCAPPANGRAMGLVPLLNELHFLALHSLSELQLGSDLLFWFHFTQALKRIIFKEHYIPALKYRPLAPRQLAAKKAASKKAASGRSSGRKKAAAPQPAEPFKLYSGWEFIGEEYETLLDRSVEYMPLLCAAGFADPHEDFQLYDRLTLLRHFSDCLLAEVVTRTRFTKAFEKTVTDSVLANCLNLDVWVQQTGREQYQQWQTWRDRIVRTQTDQPFYLYFHLLDPVNPDDPWQLQFEIAPKDDPSLKLSLEDYWRMGARQQQKLKGRLGKDFEQTLLLNLGYASRIYPTLWQGLETDQPVGIQLVLGEAFTFLKESAWVLENAGYKVLVPAWWTPQGRRRARVRLKAKGKSLSGGKDKSKSYFSLDRLVEYQYALAIGDEPVSEQEWHQLVNAKTPLVQFRGQWIELDQDKMQQMLDFWKTHQAENPELSLLDFMKLTAKGDDGELEVECDRKDMLAEMLSKLSDKTQLQPANDPDNFAGQLREYQKRGVSWLQYLEELGLNGCLADDMGLGKTIQVIARLVQEREPETGNNADRLPPTLLIAPTSVVGNWQREIRKFAPQITAAIHHGGDRAREAKVFKRACRDRDIIITSFALARKDAKLFNAIEWHRIVLDEAQNIKNPKAALTKAIYKFSAAHRLALTGTPIENRLLDLWSIFHFLNPGYLGNQTQFRKSFEVPIQKNNNLRQSATLKKLVEPFILRRVKTDQSIIKDLPDKVEQKLFCNLTKEQASLYEAVVKDVEQQLETAEEGIQRKGLILATLTKLKQVCNHPRQFLQDDSEFTAVRSHKLTRLTEMIEEARAEQDSLLVFTQFTELGHALEKYIRQTLHCNTYYLHGGTSRKKREAMIAEFQHPETEPSVFVLSLKAGGVGITLTKANHVFHFDRWWNPSVENQATDRAFRIGQKKNVFVHKFVAIGTLEERIDEMIEDKKKLAGSIVGSDESWLTELDDNAFRQLISLNKSAIME